MRCLYVERLEASIPARWPGRSARCSQVDAPSGGLLPDSVPLRGPRVCQQHLSSEGTPLRLCPPSLPGRSAGECGVRESPSRRPLSCAVAATDGGWSDFPFGTVSSPTSRHPATPQACPRVARPLTKLAAGSGTGCGQRRLARPLCLADTLIRPRHHAVLGSLRTRHTKRTGSPH